MRNHMRPSTIALVCGLELIAVVSVAAVMYGRMIFLSVLGTFAIVTFSWTVYLSNTTDRTNAVKAATAICWPVGTLLSFLLIVYGFHVSDLRNQIAASFIEFVLDSIGAGVILVLIGGWLFAALGAAIAFSAHSLFSKMRA